MEPNEAFKHFLLQSCLAHRRNIWRVVMGKVSCWLRVEGTTTLASKATASWFEQWVCPLPDDRPNEKFILILPDRAELL